MDDVCANFQKRFVALLHEMYGRPPLDTEPVDWDWSNCEVTKEEMAAAWKQAAVTPNLWATLDPLPSFDAETRGLLLDAHYAHDVWFITDRFQTPGLSSPLKQTKYWFGKHTLIQTPNVLIAKGKGPATSVLQLDAFIDDRPKNCEDVKSARPETKVFLCDSSHNKTYNDMHAGARIPRVKDLKEFLKLVLGVDTTFEQSVAANLDLLQRLAKEEK